MIPTTLCSINKTVNVLSLYHAFAGGLKKLKGLTEGVSITTNGLVLTKQLVELQRAGLDGLNISLDTLKSKKFEEITRRKGWERVMAGIDLAIQLGYDPVKVCLVNKQSVNQSMTSFIFNQFQKSIIDDVSISDNDDRFFFFFFFYFAIKF